MRCKHCKREIFREEDDLITFGYEFYYHLRPDGSRANSCEDPNDRTQYAVPGEA